MPKLNIPPEERRIWVISNLFTVSRIVVFPLLLFIKAPPTTENKIYLGLVVLWVLASDCFDGVLARKLNQVTVMGKMLDPLADTIVTIFGVI